MKKSQIIIITVVVLVLLVLVGGFYYFKFVSYPRDKDGMVYRDSRNRIYCDTEFFQSDQDEFKYEKGEKVQLLFTAPDSDVRYSFDVVGVDDYKVIEMVDAANDSKKGYSIEFEMPDTYVSVYYKVEEPFDGVSITLDENPTTGFDWKYEIFPEDILKLVEDRYVSDQSDTDEPVDGLGGTHYWKFKVIGSGTVELRMICDRGDEALYGSETIYRYDCDGETVVLEEMIVVDDLVIESMSVLWSGGYGTRAGTHPISIDFSGENVTLSTHLDEYDGKEATDLTQEVDISPDDVEYIYEQVRHDLWDIQHHTTSNYDVLDAGNQFITINGRTYGGYAPEGEGFDEVMSLVYELVGEDQIQEFREKIYEWYGETGV